MGKKAEKKVNPIKRNRKKTKEREKENAEYKAETNGREGKSGWAWKTRSRKMLLLLPGATIAYEAVQLNPAESAF